MQKKKIIAIISIMFLIDIVLTIGIINYLSKGEISKIFYTDCKIYMRDYEPSGMIQKSGDINDYLIKKVDRYYMLIPENVRNNYQENGWKICVTDKNIGSDIYFMDKNLGSDIYLAVIGRLVPNEKTIYISNRFTASFAIIHEMGHYIDCSINASETDEFLKIYDSELEAFKETYSTDIKNISTLTEYFATAYEAIILFPEKVKRNCPLTYEYISKCSKEI